MTLFNADLRVLGTIKSDESAFQQPIIKRVASATTDYPGDGTLAAAATGQRYILLSGQSSPHASWTGLTFENNDIVEYNGTSWEVVHDVSAVGEGGHTYSKEDNNYYEWDGSTWSTSGEPTGGDGIDVTTNTISVDLDTDPGLEINAAKLRAKVDGSGALERVTAGLDVKDGGIDEARLATDSVTNSKIGTGAVDTDELATNAVTTAKITDANVTEAKLATDSVTNAKIAANAVDTAEIAAAAVETAKIADANVTVAKIEVLAEAELIVGNGVANSKVDTSSAGDILSDETNGLTIKAGAVGTTELAADAVDDTKIADDAIKTEHIDYSSTKLRATTFTYAVADGTSKALTHSFGTRSVMVEIWDTVTFETVFADSVVRTDTNNVTVSLNQAPTNDLEVIITEAPSRS